MFWDVLEGDSTSELSQSALLDSSSANRMADHLLC